VKMMMPDLSLDEQAIVDPIRCHGPMTWDELEARLGTPPPLDGMASLFSRGFLLEYEGSVECSTCGGTGRLVLFRSPMRPDVTRHCDGPCMGTGSVKRQVIGVRCRDCNGAFEPNEGEGECARCAHSPTPGLDPGEGKG
jgi:hypothetical protein